VQAAAREDVARTPTPPKTAASPSQTELLDRVCGASQASPSTTSSLGVSPSSTSSPPRDANGTGYGGVWTATDDFVTQRRRTKWSVPDKKERQQVPPRVYVDNKTIIREVQDVRKLRHGDHCMIAINLVRSLSPTMDYLISFLGSIELIYFYHHFILVDDVHTIDDHGVPRTKGGGLAEIVEYANTIPEALEEVRLSSLGSWLRWPGAAARFLMNKSRCQRMALADYGDTQHLYIVVETLTEEQRAEIVKEALRVVEDHQPYHVFFNNCEHISNHISKGHFTSPNVHFGLWSICRMLFACIGIVFLNIVTGTCYSSFCVQYPLGALVGYHLFTSVPVGLQALISWCTVAVSVRRQHREGIVCRDDCYHLLGKELGRVIVVGGGATMTISLMPMIVSQTRFIIASGLVAFTYIVSDVIYNCCAHLVMRLVLIPVWGRVWLIGGSDARPGVEGKKRA